MARRKRGTDERRAELLEAARRRFVRDGFADVSVSRIVRDVGVAQGTFYYYFDSKEAALDALIGAYARELAARLEEVARDEGLDVLRALEQMVRLQLDFDAPRVRELGAIRGADAHTKLFAAAMRTLAPIYAVVLKRGQDRKVLPGEAADLLGEIMVLVTHSLLDRELVGLTDAEYARRRRAMADLFCSAIGVPFGSLDFGQAPRARRAGDRGY